MDSTSKLNFNPNDLISFTLNIDNFKKYFFHMEELTKHHALQIKDLNLKLSKFEEIEKLFEDVNAKLNLYDKKIEDLYTTQAWHATKFLELDQQNTLHKENFTVIEQSIKEHDKRLNTIKKEHEDTSSMTQENYRDIGTIFEKLSLINLQDMEDRFNKKIDKVDKEMNLFCKSEIEVFDKENTQKMFEDVRESLSHVVKRVSDLEIADRAGITGNVENFSLLDEADIDTLLNFDKKQELLNLNKRKSVKNPDEIKETALKIQNRKLSVLTKNEESQRKRESINLYNNLGQPMQENKDQDLFKKEINILKQNLEKNFEDVKTEMKEFVNNKLTYSKTEMKEFVNKKLTSLKNNKDFLIDNNTHNISKNLSNNISLNKNINDDNLNIFSETGNEIIPTSNDENKYTKKSTLNLNSNPNFDNKDTLRDQMHNSLIISFKDLENRMKQLESTVEENNKKFTQFAKDTKKNASEVSAVKIKAIAIDPNPNSRNNNNDTTLREMETLSNTIQDVLRQNDTSKLDLNTLENSLGEMKKNYTEMKENLEKVIRTQNHQGNASLKDGKSISENAKRIDNVEKVTHILKSMLEDNKGEKTDGEEGDKFNYENFYSSSQGNNIREMIRNNSNSLKVVTDRVDKIHSKMDHILSEIVQKLKKELFYESQKVFEDFKVDLKYNIVRLDEQLKYKVDKINFNEYEKQIDSKISNEFSKKIDKMDLKKSSSFLSRKIDNLETKISKTLVDTLIDVQLEEAPLIYKRGAIKDKCASCNQILPDENSSPNQTSMGKADLLERYKLKNVHELTCKYGIGSYSRILNNCQPGTIVDDLSSTNTNYNNNINMINQLNNSKSRRNVHNYSFINLPGISQNALRAEHSSISFRQTIGSSSGNIHETLSPEKKLKNAVSGELDKKIVRGENLIKSVDKMYAEKKREQDKAEGQSVNE